MKRHCSAQVPKRQWNAGPSSAQASLSFSGRRVAWATILKLHRLAPPSATVCFATTLATTSGQFDLFRNPHKRWRFFQMESGVDNKRHTNAHQPLTDRSPTEVSIPPLRQKYKWLIMQTFFRAIFRVTFSG